MDSLPVKSAALRGMLLCAALAVLGGCSLMPSMHAGFKSSPPAAADSESSSAPLATIEQAWTEAADDCGKQAGAPEINACAALVQRGRTLQCLASQFARSGAALAYTAPEGLETWGQCVDGIGQTLVGGYYLRHAEIERRMLLCHANLAAAPDARKPAVMTRLRKFIGFTSSIEEEKRLHPAEFGQVLRSSPADLQKCSTMMALTEPMQVPLAATRTPVAAPLVTPVPQSLPAAVISAREPASQAPAQTKPNVKPVKKAAPLKKLAEKAKAS